MPLNEAVAIRRNRLNNKQKHEALTAIYGLSIQETSMPDTAQFSHADIEHMRQLLAAHDTNNPKKGIETFDLNNPPKQNYVFQKFPMHMTNKAGEAKVASDEKDVAKLSKKGYMEPAEYRVHALAQATAADEAEEAAA